ncbi:MAG: hypothetical protein IPH61_07015 [Bacteroidetes bacterium]|nr:hypothetical protein [Bacteroidota bacterium]
MNRNKTILIWGVIGVAFVMFFIFVYLPYADRRDATTKFADGLTSSDLLHEPIKQVPAFSFVNQAGKIITEKMLQVKYM